MSGFDLKTAIGSFAPTLATMLGGPLIGGAVTALMGAFGITTTGDQGSDLAAITSVIQSGNMSPDIIAAVRLADQKHSEIINQQGIDLMKINSDHEAAMAATYTADTQDARKTFGQQKAIFWLGITVLAIFLLVMSAVLYAAYALLIGGITIKDVSVVAAISGMVGSIVGYVAGNAQQVVSYFFGSSHGSDNKTVSMGNSISKLVDSVGSKK
jgi:hypothetical protein